MSSEKYSIKISSGCVVFIIVGAYSGHVPTRTLPWIFFCYNNKYVPPFFHIWVFKLLLEVCLFWTTVAAQRGDSVEKDLLPMSYSVSANRHT